MALVLFHYTYRYDELFPARPGLWLSFRAGESGVMLFFMISGFVTLGALERAEGPLEFVWRRFSRLYPAYWAALATTFGMVGICQLPGQRVSWSDALLNLTMVQRVLGARHVDGVYWSLQVELLFYAAMLIAWLAIGARRLAPLMTIWLLIALGTHPLAPLLETRGIPLGQAVEKLSTLANLEYIHLFAIGVGLYQWRHGGPRWEGMAVVLLAIAIHTIEQGWLEGLTILTLTVAVAAAVSGHLRPIAVRPLVWLGSISYALYLVHQNIGYCVIRALDGYGANPWLGVLAATCVSIGLAVAITHWVERPAHDWLTAPRAKNVLADHGRLKYKRSAAPLVQCSAQ